MGSWRQNRWMLAAGRLWTHAPWERTKRQDGRVLASWCCWSCLARALHHFMSSYTSRNLYFCEFMRYSDTDILHRFAALLCRVLSRMDIRRLPRSVSDTRPNSCDLNVRVGRLLAGRDVVENARCPHASELISRHTPYGCKQSSWPRAQRATPSIGRKNSTLFPCGMKSSSVQIEPATC